MHTAIVLFFKTTSLTLCIWIEPSEFSFVPFDWNWQMWLANCLCSIRVRERLKCCLQYPDKVPTICVLLFREPSVHVTYFALNLLPNYYSTNGLFIILHSPRVSLIKLCFLNYQGKFKRGEGKKNYNLITYGPDEWTNEGHLLCLSHYWANGCTVQPTIGSSLKYLSRLIRGQIQRVQFAIVGPIVPKWSEFFFSCLAREL